MTSTPTTSLFTEHPITADGFDFRYFEAGSGAPLVVLHPAGGPQLGRAHELLAERFRVIAFEYPGYGAEVNERTKDAKDMARTILAALDILDLHDITLVGTSMSGVVASWLAVFDPDRLTCLILDVPAAFRREADPSQMTPEEIMAAFHAHPERKHIPPHDQAAQDRVWPLVLRLVGPPHDSELEAGLRKMPVPTLVMLGTHDGLFGIEAGRTFKQIIPRCTFTMVYDAAHDIAGDRPEAYADLVADFTERQERFYVTHASTMINR